MSRDKTLDGIFLQNFFKNSVGFLTLEQPATEDEYLEGYARASHEWLSLRSELNTYTLAAAVKNDLTKLFDLAENFFYYVNSSDHSYRSQFMSQKWAEIKRLAKTISNSVDSN